ncbi:MAG: hypothetical protein QW228_07540 [Candidatus Aenigmatarchaeota archaeon]
MVYETIRIKNTEEKFIVLDLLDFPTELISSNGKYYMLYIKDDKDGELWFLIENIPKTTLAEYLKGNIPVEDLFKQGTTKVVKRPYTKIDQVEDTNYSVKDFELPRDSLENYSKGLEELCTFLDNEFRELLEK